MAYCRATEEPNRTAHKLVYSDQIRKGDRGQPPNSELAYHQGCPIRLGSRSGRLAAQLAASVALHCRNESHITER